MQDDASETPSHILVPTVCCPPTYGVAYCQPCLSFWCDLFVYSHLDTHLNCGPFAFFCRDSLQEQLRDLKNSVATGDQNNSDTIKKELSTVEKILEDLTKQVASLTTVKTLQISLKKTNPPINKTRRQKTRCLVPPPPPPCVSFRLFIFSLPFLCLSRAFLLLSISAKPLMQLLP